MRAVTLTDVDAYVRRCFEHETPPRVAELAGSLGLSRSRFSEVFASLSDLCPSAYLKQQQLEYAAKLLSDTDLTSAEVAYRAGFGTRRTLFRAFRRTVDATPLSFRSLDRMSLALGRQKRVQPLRRSK